MHGSSKAMANTHATIHGTKISILDNNDWNDATTHNYSFGRTAVKRRTTTRSIKLHGKGEGKN
jgi:hypothetical protein